MIKNYAHEEAGKDGKPSGTFVFKRADAMAAAHEILGTHMGLTGAAAEKYLGDNFDATWKHFNSASDGKVDAARMAGFYHHLMGNNGAPLYHKTKPAGKNGQLVQEEPKKEVERAPAGFPASADGEKGYVRNVPERFSGSGDDQFMKSMIKNYAYEEADANGKPSGIFVFRREEARAAAEAILQEHPEAKFDDQKFDKTWKHFDSANEGRIGVEKLLGFYR